MPSEVEDARELPSSRLEGHLRKVSRAFAGAWGVAEVCRLVAQALEPVATV